MLVLTRKMQEQLIIGDQITITIVRLQGDRVRLGIEAPKHVRVMRGEVAAKEAHAGEQPATQAEHVAPGDGHAAAEADSPANAQPGGQVASPLATWRSRAVPATSIPTAMHAV